MHQLDNNEFPLIGAIYLRAINVLNRRKRELWRSDVASLRIAMNHLIESEYAAELETFSNEFAERLARGDGWEVSLLPAHLLDEDGSIYANHEDARALLGNWPDPTKPPDGYPDQKISDIEALEEVIFQRKKNPEHSQPSEAQSYALMALEKISIADAMLANDDSRSLSDLPAKALLSATKISIEAMELVCIAERRLVAEKLPASSAELVRQLESEARKEAKRAMAKSGAETRWKYDPATAAKQQVKECWDMWQADPSRYKSQKEFAFDMLSKYEEVTHADTIQKWCRAWKKDRPGNNTTLPA